MRISNGTLKEVTKKDLKRLKSNPDKFWKGVTRIGSCAFDKCESLTSITIPNSVTWIDDHAFLGCKSLTSITIPNSVSVIGKDAFLGCKSLEEFNVESGNTKYKATPDKRCLLDSDNKLIEFAPAGLTSYSIPEGVTAIGESTFEDCSSLTSINIPNSVTWIDDHAFAYCKSLISITIPEGVTKIGWYAFYNCSSLTSITIPNSVTEIRGYAFYNCKSLTSINIPKSVTEIGWYAFEGCSSLTSITITEGAWINNNEFSHCPNLKIAWVKAAEKPETEVKKPKKADKAEEPKSETIRKICRILQLYYTKLSNGKLSNDEIDKVMAFIESTRKVIDNDPILKRLADEIISKKEENAENE